LTQFGRLAALEAAFDAAQLAAFGEELQLSIDRSAEFHVPGD
jgi:hypothetical protein